jgi:integrase
LERDPLGREDALKLSTQRLVEFVQARRTQGAGPSTAGNDLIWIGVVLRAAKSIKQLPVPLQAVDEAQIACRELKLIGKSRRRERRPTAEEQQKLDAFFVSRDGRARIPMLDIVHFAATTSRREDEICRILWEDNDPKTRTGLVRDAKHPRHKEGNHRRFRYTQEAWEILERQPKTDARIFPYKAKSVSTAFTRACTTLGIVDLHFHDYRHEATSRLFEMGYQIQEVALFTLHESWEELKRYTNPRPENMRDLSPPKRLDPALTQPDTRTGEVDTTSTVVALTQGGHRHQPGDRSEQRDRSARGKPSSPGANARVRTDRAA